MPAYPGLPDARVRPVLSHSDSRDLYDGQAEFCLTQVNFASNTGTYLDSPWHRYADGPDIGALPLEVPGWDEHWGQERYWAGPHLGAAALDLLVEAPPTLVGVDFANGAASMPVRPYAELVDDVVGAAPD